MLALRIPRAAPWRGQAGCGLTLGILLTLFGGGICWFAAAHDDYGLPMVVGGAFALVGLLLVYSGIHQLIASRLPETIFELNELPLQRGDTRAGMIIQEGPVNLQSLRVNLVCLVYITERVRRKGQKSTWTKQLWDANVLDVGAVELRSGEKFHWDVSFEVPRNAKPTGGDGKDRVIEWRVEVWGRVRGRPDFMHPFIVEVQ